MREDDALLLSGRDAIDGINWLTVLSSDFLARHGGEAQLLARIGSAAQCHRYSAGIVLQAGPSPRWIEGPEVSSEHAAVRDALSDMTYA